MREALSCSAFYSTVILSSWVHTGRYSGRCVVMRWIVKTNRPHHVVCTHYMRAPSVGNDVVWSGVHAAQSHDIINDVMGLSCAAPGYRSRLWIHTARCARTNVKSLTTSLVFTLSRVYPALVVSCHFACIHFSPYWSIHLKDIATCLNATIYSQIRQFDKLLWQELGLCMGAARGVNQDIWPSEIFIVITQGKFPTSWIISLLLVVI